MGYAQIESFRTEKEAIDYVNSQTEWDKERLYIFFDLELGGKDTPFTVNVD